MILDLIRKRRAVYPVQYNDENISKTEIEKILEAANWAPTHRRTEPWRFKVIQGEAQNKLSDFLSGIYKEKAEKFSEKKYKKYQVNPVKSACVIAVCLQRDPNETIPEWEEIAATAMAVQNMWLTASEMKIGAYWGSPGVCKYMDEFLPMETGERCLGFFYMGKYDDELTEGTRKTSIQEKTIWM